MTTYAIFLQAVEIGQHVLTWYLVRLLADENTVLLEVRTAISCKGFTEQQATLVIAAFVCLP